MGALLKLFLDLSLQSKVLTSVVVYIITKVIGLWGKSKYTDWKLVRMQKEFLQQARSAQLLRLRERKKFLIDELRKLKDNM